MLKIRLTRTGKKKKPNYRVVITEHTKAVKGKFFANLGHYNPFTKKLVIDKDTIMDWLKKGAKPSNTVAKLLEKEGLKHKSIIIKKFAAKSEKQLEAEKKLAEEEKAKEQAEKEAKKVEFEKEQAEKQEEKAQEAKKAEAKTEQENQENIKTEANSSESGRTANNEQKSEQE